MQFDSLPDNAQAHHALLMLAGSAAVQWAALEGAIVLLVDGLPAAVRRGDDAATLHARRLTTALQVGVLLERTRRKKTDQRELFGQRRLSTPHVTLGGVLREPCAPVAAARLRCSFALHSTEPLPPRKAFETSLS